MSRLFGLFAVQANMHIFWLLVMILYNEHFISTCTSAYTGPDIVNIGAILSFNTSIGKVAIEAAVEDVNSDPRVLNGTKLKLSMQDTKLSSRFLDFIEGTSFETSYVYSFTIIFISFSFGYTFHCCFATL